MTQEEKDILLRYLCMALPYGVMVQDDMGRTYKLELGNAYLVDLYYENGDYVEAPIKPYLRPLESMTEEEHNEWFNYYHEIELKEAKSNGDYLKAAILGESASIDWLLKNRFDFMGLIPMGAAIEITNENNPY